MTAGRQIVSSHATDGVVPGSYVGKLAPNRFCRAWNPRREKYCRARAGAGTDHSGTGRCSHHGGNARVRTGLRRRFAGVTRPRLRELVAEYAADPTPLDILPELAAARALVHDFMERRSNDSEQLAERIAGVIDELAAATGHPDAHLAAVARARDALAQLTGFPLPDMADATRMIERVTKIVERIERIRAANAISWPDFERLLMAMGQIVKRHLPDDVIAQRIQAEWLALRI